MGLDLALNDSGGNVGIGTTIPTERLTVAGNVAPNLDNLYDLGTATLRWDDIFATNATIQTSDLRGKQDVVDLPYGLVLVNALRPVEYRWKDVVSPEVTEVVTKSRPVTMAVAQRRTEIVEVDGKYIQRTIKETVEKAVLDRVPLHDESGAPLFDEEGNPLLHSVPRVEEYQETVVITPAINSTHKRKHFGLIAQEVEALLNANNIDTSDFSAFIYDADTDTYGMRYGELIPVLLKAVQELSGEVEALKTA